MNRVASCMVDDRLKQARAIIREACERAAEAGCPAVAVCIMPDEDLTVSGMGVSTCLQDDPAQETALMLCAIGRCMAFLVLDYGAERTTLLVSGALAGATKMAEGVARGGGK